ncbi:MAG TPA: hypothetical protein VHP38_17105 [Ruminiclostridium sp.]|nr:hypothetical protein [Ruminiclostridium sp.]
MQDASRSHMRSVAVQVSPRPPSARVVQGLTCELCGYPGARKCSCYALVQDTLRKNRDKIINTTVRVMCCSVTLSLD